MAEYSANAVQTVAVGAPVLFTESPVPCNRGFIFHREGSGVFRLASPSHMSSCQNWGWNNCCCCQMPEAMYEVAFHANIAIPTDPAGTVAPISLAVSIDGEPDLSSTMIITPAAAGDYGNVGAEIMVAVPAICGCESIAIRNTSDQAILVQNANLVISYRGVKY